MQKRIEKLLKTVKKTLKKYYLFLKKFNLNNKYIELKGINFNILNKV